MASIQGSGKELGDIIDAALGRTPSSLQLKNAKYLDVFSCQWIRGDISIHNGFIVGIEPGLKAKQVVDLKGKSVVPGFIDAHVHIESSLVTPGNFEKMALGKGTTTAICDPHEITNVMGIKGLKYFLSASEKTHMDLKVMLSSCVPSTSFETNGAGRLTAEDLIPLAKHRNVLGLAEMMNVPGVLNKDKDVLKKISMFSGRVVDGHSPLLKGEKLSAYIAAGVSNCHESSQYEEAREKLIKGMSIWIREGSVAKDLHALIPLLNAETSTSIGFCTDDRNPLDTAREGHIDYLIRSAIKHGVRPELAYRCASWSVARHYGLKRYGAIAPGYVADLVILDSHETCAVSSVYKRGELVDGLDFHDQGKKFGNSVKAHKPTPKDLEGPKGRVHVISVEEGKIITQRQVMSHDAKGVAKLTVLERYGKNRKPANGYVTGFGENFNGAIASSVGHDSHNLIAIGSNSYDMSVAMGALIDCGGGFCVVKNGAVCALLELPFGGLMSYREPKEVEARLVELHQASQSVGCVLKEPFLQLAFLSLPVIPSLKLTDKGLVDVEKFKIIDVRAS